MAHWARVMENGLPPIVVAIEVALAGLQNAIEPFPHDHQGSRFNNHVGKAKIGGAKTQE
ncbi:MAG: hypothetical protein R3E01_01750 [Pirellulaceae bacterium]|nr:hypothetical protein [Planctomycetales bacterium]